MPGEESVSEWIVGAKAGQSKAIERLWHRYFERLVQLARRLLADAQRRVADEEDVALSAFASFCRGAAERRFPDLNDRDGLWRLLIRFTAQKAVDLKRHQRRKKRGEGRVRGESVWASDGPANDQAGLAQVIGDSPTPEFAAMIAEQLRHLLNRIDEDDRLVALARMEGYTNREIAHKLGCSLSTVERSLRLIRRVWEEGAEK